jgi:hypothetical protein
MVSMSIFIENFAKTQQRSLQSMKDTCSKLRQKNAMLEEILNSSKISIVLAQALSDLFRHKHGHSPIHRASSTSVVCSTTASDVRRYVCAKLLSDGT